MVNVTATLEYLGGVPGNQTFRFDYTVENVDIQPAAAGFIVFFDADNVDRADFVSFTAPSGWEEVSVYPETPPDAFWNVEWDELFGTNRILPGTSLGGFSVTFTWKDPIALPGSQFFEAWNGEAHEGYTTVVPGSSLLGGIGGTVVTVCGGNTAPAAGVTVGLFTMGNVMLATTATDINGHYSFPELAAGSYKITIVTPPGYVADQETKTASVSMGQATVVDFQLSCLPGSIGGTVVTVCGGNTAPAAGVTVDLFTMNNVMLESVTTDINGHYSFPGLAAGDYKITIVTPAGFVADEETKMISVSAGQAAVVNFQLSCLTIVPDARTIGYWKHQVNSYLSGKGKAQETLDNMVYWINEIGAHFNGNLLNPVKMIEIDPETDKLVALDRLLTVNKDGTMLDRARQQALALLLNVVSLKLSQAQVISANGANVSQAITYVNQLIMDKVTSNDERAKDIADYINNGMTVPSGWIPISTPIIYYERDRHGAIVYLGKGCPNPFSSTASIAFALKGNGLVPVELKVFDVTGRVVKTLISDALEPGQHSVGWNGMSDEGAKVSSGVYFYELKTPTAVATGKLVYRR